MVTQLEAEQYFLKRPGVTGVSVSTSTNQITVYVAEGKDADGLLDTFGGAQVVAKISGKIQGREY